MGKIASLAKDLCQQAQVRDSPVLLELLSRLSPTCCVGLGRDSFGSRAVLRRFTRAGACLGELFTARVAKNHERPGVDTRSRVGTIRELMYSKRARSPKMVCIKDRSLMVSKSAKRGVVAFGAASWLDVGRDRTCSLVADTQCLGHLQCLSSRMATKCIRKQVTVSSPSCLTHRAIAEKGEGSPPSLSQADTKRRVGSIPAKAIQLFRSLASKTDL